MSILHFGARPRAIARQLNLGEVTFACERFSARASHKPAEAILNKIELRWLAAFGLDLENGRPREVLRHLFRIHSQASFDKIELWLAHPRDAD